MTISSTLFHRMTLRINKLECLLIERLSNSWE